MKSTQPDLQAPRYGVSYIQTTPQSEKYHVSYIQTSPVKKEAQNEHKQQDKIQINRAPVLTLWAAVVAEREGLSFCLVSLLPFCACTELIVLSMCLLIPTPFFVLWSLTILLTCKTPLLRAVAHFLNHPVHVCTGHSFASGLTFGKAIAGYFAYSKACLLSSLSSCLLSMVILSQGKSLGYMQESHKTPEERESQTGEHDMITTFGIQVSGERERERERDAQRGKHDISQPFDIQVSGERERETEDRD